MTITIQPARNEYTANAGQTIFNYTFKIFEDTDLNVYVTPAGQEPSDSTDLTNDYTVTGLGDEDGGAITLNSGATQDSLITIVSNIPSSRSVDYQNNGDFRPTTVNNDFDRVLSIVKKIEDTSNRGLKFDQSKQGPKPLSLPEPESEKFLAWKPDLSGVENRNPPGVFIPEQTEATVQAMKSNSSLQPGQLVNTVDYYSTQRGGGASYLIKTVAQAAIDGDVIDGYLNHAINGGLYVAINQAEEVYISTFGSTCDALQSALDWADSTGGVLIQDNDITVDKNIFYGNLKIKAGGGNWHVLADSNWTETPGGGNWTGEVAISAQGTPQNTMYGLPNTARYLIQIERGVSITMLRTSSDAPWYPIRFLGAKVGSYCYLNSNCEGVDLTCNSPDFYFNNQLTIGGSHELTLSNVNDEGGLWIRQLGLSTDIQYKSNLILDMPVAVKTNGADEAIAIFNTSGLTGYLSVTGPGCVAHASSGIGFTILNNSGHDNDGFSVDIATVIASCDAVKDGNNGVVKIKNTAASIGSINATMRGHDIVTIASGAVLNIVDSSIQNPASIGSATLTIDGVLECGDNVVSMTKGNATITKLDTHIIAGSSLPDYSVKNNRAGAILGGVMVDGVQGCAKSACIKGGTVNGLLSDCLILKPDYVNWDTDKYADSIIELTQGGGAGWEFTNKAEIDVKAIKAYGSTKPSRVIAVDDPDVLISSKYLLDHGGVVGGAPSFEDQAGGRYLSYTVQWFDGSDTVRKFKVPYKRFISTQRVSVDTAVGTVDHLLGSAPVGAVATLVGSEVALNGYTVQTHSFGATTVGVKVFDESGVIVTSGTYSISLIAFNSNIEFYS